MSDERSLCAHLINSPQTTYRDCLDLVQERSFSDLVLGAFWGSVGELVELGRSITSENLGERFRARKRPFDDGLMAGLYAALPTRSARECAEDVRIAFWLREADAVVASGRVDMLAAESPEDRREVEVRVAAEIASLGAQEGLRVARSGEFDSAVIFPHESNTGALRTPWSEVDDLTGGLAPGRLWTVGGASGSGKTWWALALADGLATFEQALLGRPARVLYGSVEMTGEELEARLVALRKGVAPSEAASRAAESEAFTQAPAGYRVTLAHAGSLRLADLRSELQRERHDVLVVDFAQILTLDESKSSRREALDVLAYDLKRLAKDMKIAVVALVQLNRASTQSTFGMPRISHIRETGVFEQASDAVLLLWRPQSYVEMAVEDASERDRLVRAVRETLGDQYAETIIAKARHGRMGRVKMRFGANCRWEMPTYSRPLIGDDGLGGIPKRLPGEMWL